MTTAAEGSACRSHRWLQWSLSRSKNYRRPARFASCRLPDRRLICGNGRKTTSRLAACPCPTQHLPASLNLVKRLDCARFIAAFPSRRLEPGHRVPTARRVALRPKWAHGTLATRTSTALRISRLRNSSSCASGERTAADACCGIAWVVSKVAVTAAKGCGPAGDWENGHRHAHKTTSEAAAAAISHRHRKVAVGCTGASPAARTARTIVSCKSAGGWESGRFRRRSASRRLIES